MYSCIYIFYVHVCRSTFYTWNMDIHMYVCIGWICTRPTSPHAWGLVVRADRLHLNTRRRYSLCQIHPHTCTYMYIYVYIHIHTYMYMCIHVYTCTCIYLYIHICIYICTYIYVYIYMYICVHVVYIHISIRTEQSELISCTSMKTGTLFAMAKFANLIDPVTQDFEVCICTRIQMFMWIFTLHIYIYMYTCMTYIFIFFWICVYIHICVFRYTHVLCQVSQQHQLLMQWLYIHIYMFVQGSTKAFMVDAVSTSLGAVMGTSPVTTYIESAPGIEEGG